MAVDKMNRCIFSIPFSFDGILHTLSLQRTQTTHACDCNRSRSQNTLPAHYRDFGCLLKRSTTRVHERTQTTSYAHDHGRDCAPYTTPLRQWPRPERFWQAATTPRPSNGPQPCRPLRSRSCASIRSWEPLCASRALSIIPRPRFLEEERSFKFWARTRAQFSEGHTEAKEFKDKSHIIFSQFHHFRPRRPGQLFSYFSNFWIILARFFTNFWNSVFHHSKCPSPRGKRYG